MYDYDHSPAFTGNSQPLIMKQYHPMPDKFIFSSSSCFKMGHIIEWHFVINGYRTRQFAISTQYTYTITTYLFKPINFSTLHMSMKVTFYYVRKGMSGKNHITGIPFLFIFTAHHRRINGLCGPCCGLHRDRA